MSKLDQLDNILLQKRIRCIVSTLRFSNYFLGDSLQVTKKLKEKKTYKLNIKKICMVIIHLALILYTIYYNFFIDNDNFFSKSVRVIVLGMIVMAGMQSLFMITSISTIMLDFLRTLAGIDLALFQNKMAMSSLSYHSLRKRTDRRILIILACFSLKQIIITISFKLNSLLTISLFIFDVSNYLLTFLFVTCCDQSIERLSRVHRAFGDLHRCAESQRDVSGMTNTKEIADRLYSLFNMNTKICRMIRELFASFSLMVTCAFWLFAIRVLFNAYMFYNACFNDTIPKVFDIFHSTIILIHDLSMLFLIVWHCERIIDKVDRTHILLHELRNLSFDVELDNHIQIYSLQLIHQKVNMSALGLFDVDNSAFYGVFMGVITYMILMIQFDQNPRQATKMIQDSR